MVIACKKETEEVKNILTELSQKNRAYLTAQDGRFGKQVYEYQIPGDDPTQVSEVPPAQLYNFLYTPDGIRILEEWYRIEKGALYEGFTTMKDSSGREMQSTVARPDGIGINFALEDAGDPETRDLALCDSKAIEYAPTPLEETQTDWVREDVDLYKTFAVAQKAWLQTIELKHFGNESRRVFVVYLETYTPQPAHIPGVKAEVLGSSVTYFFDIQTGELVASETRVRTQDGEWIVTAFSEARSVIYSHSPDAQQKQFDDLLNRLKAIRGEK